MAVHSALRAEDLKFNSMNLQHSVLDWKMVWKTLAAYLGKVLLVQVDGPVRAGDKAAS